MSNSYTKNSNTVFITVLDKPRATLTAGTTIIPVGGSVTLTCSVQSSDGWKYEWFRRTQTTSEVQIKDQENRDIRVSQGGIYSCRGTRGNPVYYTDISDDVTIEITFSNKVVVKQQPNWPQIFRGETITLTCEVQEGGETTEWEYEWRGPRTHTQWTHNNDWTFRVSEFSRGDYMCKSRRRDDSYSSTEWSEAFTLSVSTDHPKAQIIIDVRDIPVGGSVTLSCSVNSSSSGWKYYWYRDENSSEPLTTQDAVQMQLQMQLPSDGQISVSQEGLYRCRGGRGNPVYYTEDSDPLIIDKNAPQSFLEIRPITAPNSEDTPPFPRSGEISRRHLPIEDFRLDCSPSAPATAASSHDIPRSLLSSSSTSVSLYNTSANIPTTGPEEPVQSQATSAGGPEEPSQPEVSSAGGLGEPSHLQVSSAGGPESPVHLQPPCLRPRLAQLQLRLCLVLPRLVLPRPRLGLPRLVLRLPHRHGTQLVLFRLVSAGRFPGL
ncbi:uncharacterized protein LOC112845412 [Oreochromis niloticus]|uniref:uncharacterized protein LOC112845412 n=1 Tax=Oreochromis niloticus TaxID=8128 RepID=UPI000DF41D8E|nr:uncharacterized protein LOC112845412 [Oreochromis niloticus]